MPRKREPEYSEEVKRIFKTLSKKDLKEIAFEAYKEAAHEFMLDIWARFGKWSFITLTTGFVLFLFGVYVFLGAWLKGWRPAP